MYDDLQPDASLTAIELMRQLAVASAHPGDDPDRVIADQVSTVDRYLEKYADSDPGMTCPAVYLLAWCLTLPCSMILSGILYAFGRLFL